MSAPTPVAVTPSGAAPLAGDHPNRLRALWNAVTGALGAVLGLAPHVLHHIGLLAGTALVAGSGGTALFGAIGLAASVPFLLRLYRRFGSWRAPAIGLGVFAVMFSLSAFVLGPAISGGSDSPAPSAPGVTTDEHGH
ncbi:hypothetical protein [Sporichthya polymorpha]|uniref:hypothetical protein n=1 Tax=Sporichthya polymorpha TaxID=35751 RepID=UPI00039DB219|nr:hypothetical protein [Sporichthya polymorpha]